MAESTNVVAAAINSVVKFDKDLHNLVEILGKSDVTVLAPGSALTIYKTTGTLDSSTVAAGALIPLSEIEAEIDRTIALTYGKYRKVTPIETIMAIGDAAVAATDDEMLRQVQSKARKQIMTAVQSGTKAATAGTNFQTACANAWAALESCFEDEAITPVFFANPTDVAEYLGSATISNMGEAAGVKYLSNFLGLGTLIIDSNIAAGKVWATAAENINVVAASIDSIPGMDLVTDESGIIAVHNGSKPENGGIETVAYCGLACALNVLDRCVSSEC